MKYSYSEYFNTVAISIERLLAGVYLESNLLCLCLHGFCLRAEMSSWKLHHILAHDCVSGFHGQVGWNPAFWVGWLKDEDSEFYLLFMYHIFTSER